MIKVSIALVSLCFIASGCVGGKFFKKTPSVPGSPAVAQSFDFVDTDGNGTIDKEEYYSSTVSINTEQPTWGLAWIILSVIVCTLGSAVVYRKKSTEGDE